MSGFVGRHALISYCLLLMVAMVVVGTGLGGLFIPPDIVVLMFVSFWRGGYILYAEKER